MVIRLSALPDNGSDGFGWFSLLVSPPSANPGGVTSFPKPCFDSTPVSNSEGLLTDLSQL